MTAVARPALGSRWSATLVLCAAVATSVRAAEGPVMSRLELPDGRVVTRTVRPVELKRRKSERLVQETLLQVHEWTIEVQTAAEAPQLVMRVEVGAEVKPEGGSRCSTLVASGRPNEIVTLDARTSGGSQSPNVVISGCYIDLNGTPRTGDIALRELASSKWNARMLTDTTARPELTSLVASNAGTLIAIGLLDNGKLVAELAIDPSKRLACAVQGTDLDMTWEPYGLTPKAAPAPAPQ